MQDNNGNPENQQLNGQGPAQQSPYENANTIGRQDPASVVQPTSAGNITPNGPSGVPPAQLPANPAFTSEPQMPVAAADPPKKSKKWVLFGIITLLALGIAAYALYSTQHKSTPAKKSSVSTQAPAACSSETCFTPYFKNCSPAILTVNSPLGSVKYQTYAKKDAGCSMLFEYTSNPNPAWVNQPMTCSFDNTKSLEDSISAVIDDLGNNKKNTYSCIGPLVQILQNP